MRHRSSSRRLKTTAVLFLVVSSLRPEHSGDNVPKDTAPERRGGRRFFAGKGERRLGSTAARHGRRRKNAAELLSSALKYARHSKESSARRRSRRARAWRRWCRA